MDNPLYGQPGQKRLTTFLNPNISVGDALSGFSSGNNRLVEDLKLSVLSFGFKGFGGVYKHNDDWTFSAALVDLDSHC